MRKVRKSINLIFTIVGSSLVLFAFMQDYSFRVRALIVVIGLLVTEAGIWNLTRAILPNEREFRALRNEVDYFRKMVRQLNAAAIRKRGEPSEENEARFSEIVKSMHHSVDRMTGLAGMTDEDLGLTPTVRS